MKRLTYLLLVAVVLLSIGVGKAYAQANASAALQGTISDQSDAAIKGAKVAITSSEQGWTRNADTSDAGFYRFELLPAGTYSIKVNAPGFRVFTRLTACRPSLASATTSKSDCSSNIRRRPFRNTL